MATSERVLSVVVPTYQRPELLRLCLAALAAQDLDPAAFEVVVVDDGSGDATAEVLAAAADNVVPLVQTRNTGPAAARNRGVAEARAPLVLFLDDDVVAAPDLLSTHLAMHAEIDDPAVGVLGHVAWHPTLEVTPFMRWIDRSNLQFGYDTWLREGPVDPPYAAFYTANLSMGKAMLHDVGGFDERFPYAAFEDIELAYRLTQNGFRLHYRPAARAFHARPMNLAGFCRRMERVGESAELIREAAPEFPLDDAELLRHRTRRRRRWEHAARLVLRRDDAARSAYYWARVAAAYQRGRARAQAGR